MSNIAAKISPHIPNAALIADTIRVYHAGADAYDGAVICGYHMGADDMSFAIYVDGPTGKVEQIEFWLGKRTVNIHADGDIVVDGDDTTQDLPVTLWALREKLILDIAKLLDDGNYTKAAQAIGMVEKLTGQIASLTKANDE